MKEAAVYREMAQSSNRAEYGEDLVHRHASLVKRIAYHLMCRLPPSVQIDDLIQAGMIGLLEASRHYDLSQGATFETYAGIRIRGAMLDEIRKGDWAPPSLHRKVRQLAKVVKEIETEQSRDARDVEVAERLGVTLDQYYQLLHDATTHRILSFEDVPTKAETQTEGLTDKIPGPHEELENNDFREALMKAIASLPERERLVMSLYYDNELNLREVGEILGVSESRVCQLHAQTLIRLRARMSEWLE
jgi:RNA polymerase sigma factor for flagellar operon FliA